MAIEDVNNRMLEYTAAAHASITDWSDTRVRGYLKEHPDIVEQSVARLEGMLVEVRQQIAIERADNRWGGPLPEGAALEHYVENVNAYAEHSCDCEWCLCCEPAGVGDEPIVLLTISASDMAAACPACQASPGDPCRRDGLAVASHPARRQASGRRKDTA